MSTKHLLVLCMVGCSSELDGPEPCAAAPVVMAGTAQVGLGRIFSPVMHNEEVGIVYGIQRLRMFVVSARVRDMDMGADRVGGVDFAAFDEADNMISLGNVCRTREFVETSDGWWELNNPYYLVLVPGARIDRELVTIRLGIRTLDGQHAVDERTIIAREAVDVR